MTSYLSRVYSSERISSSHGADIFYEFVHAHVKHDPNAVNGTDVVIIRMIQDNRPNEALAPEIHVKDLMEVEERFLVFMDRVRKKSGDTTTLGGVISGVSPVQGVTMTQPQMPQLPIAPAAIVSNPTPMPMMSPIYQQPQPQPQPQAQPQPQQQPTPQPVASPIYAAQPTPTPEPMGRFAPGAPRRKIGGMPDEAAMRSGPKKSSFALDANGNVVGQPTPNPGTETRHGSGAWTAPPKDSDTQGGEGVSSYEIVPFSLQKPPDLEEVLRVLASDQTRLVVVARMELMDKIKIYLENVIRGDGALANKPGVFSAIVLHRQGGKINFKAKMSGPLALAIQQIVANPTKVLWVPPESAQVSR